MLFWLCDNRKRRGDIGLEGYFSVDRIADVMQLRGYVLEDVAAACSWLVKRELVEADHMNRSGVSGHDCVKVTASGFIHLRILCERIEYLYGVLSVTPIIDSGVANKIAQYLNRENQHDRISGHQMVQCVRNSCDTLSTDIRDFRRPIPNLVANGQAPPSSFNKSKGR